VTLTTLTDDLSVTMKYGMALGLAGAVLRSSSTSTSSPEFLSDLLVLEGVDGFVPFPAVSFSSLAFSSSVLSADGVSDAVLPVVAAFGTVLSVVLPAVSDEAFSVTAPFFFSLSFSMGFGIFKPGRSRKATVHQPQSVRTINVNDLFCITDLVLLRGQCGYSGHQFSTRKRHHCFGEQFPTPFRSADWRVC
jgi:hypothetical protein